MVSVYVFTSSHRGDDDGGSEDSQRKEKKIHSGWSTWSQVINHGLLLDWLNESPLLSKFGRVGFGEL